MSSKSYCKHRLVSRARRHNQPSAGPLERRECCRAPAEIEICAISTAKSGILVTSFLSNHENICSRNPAAYTAHFQINTGHYIQDEAKSIPLQFFAVSGNFKTKFYCHI